MEKQTPLTVRSLVKVHILVATQAATNDVSERQKGAQVVLSGFEGSSPPGRKNSHDTILRDIKDSIGKGSASRKGRRARHNLLSGAR